MFKRLILVIVALLTLCVLRKPRRPLVRSEVWVYYVPSLRLALCVPHKNASTATLWFLQKSKAKYSSRPLAEVTREEGLRLVAFVRDPYMRLVSAYLDLMVRRNSTQCRAFYSNWKFPSHVFDELPCPLSFFDTLQVLEAMSVEHRNAHFGPQSRLCRYSETKYDEVLDVDAPSFQKDAGDMLERLGINRTMWPASKRHMRASGASKRACEFYEDANTTRLATRLVAEDLRLGALGRFHFEAPVCHTVGNHIESASPNSGARGGRD